MGRWMARCDGGTLMGFPLDLSFFSLFYYFFLVCHFLLSRLGHGVRMYVSSILAFLFLFHRFVFDCATFFIRWGLSLLSIACAFIGNTGVLFSHFYHDVYDELGQIKAGVFRFSFFKEWAGQNFHCAGRRTWLSLFLFFLLEET